MYSCPILEPEGCTSGLSGSQGGERGPIALSPMAEVETSPSSPAEAEAGRPGEVLRKPIPGTVYPWVRRASWIELGVFAILLVVWAIPGMERATFYAGLAHGIGYVALVVVIWIAVLRHEAPYTLLAATLTPVGPVGSVIAIEWLDRRQKRRLEAP
jgi:hypothetical protein